MTLLSVQNVEVSFKASGGTVRAVRDVSLDIRKGEKVGLVGESGCGKSSLGRAIMRLSPVSAGQIELDGVDIAQLNDRELRPLRPLMQMIFQDSYGSINPRHTIGKSIGQPLQLAGWSGDRIASRVKELLGLVGLPAAAAHRYPHEFSGGQRQRIGIARALALNPKLLICDEPVSALDVSVRAQIINLLDDLRRDLGVSFLFISHDLSVVRHFADRVLVMYLGRLVETGETESLWLRSAHPYTRALIGSAPQISSRKGKPSNRPTLQGELPNPLNPPPGCAFSSRCVYAIDRCRTEMPELRSKSNTHLVACHLDLPGVAAP